MDEIICNLAGAEPAITTCITAQILGAQNRCYAIIALLIRRDLPEGLRKQFKTLINDTHGPQAERNRAVHDAWFLEPTEDIPARYKKMAREEWIYGIESVSKEQIEETIAKIRALQLKASQLRQSVSIELGS